MKQLLHLLAAGGCLVALPHLTQAQTPGVGIGTTAPDASAALDIVSTSKGALLPRLTAAQRLGIASPSPGLIVYQNDAPTSGVGAGTLAGFWFNAGTAATPNWQRLSTPGDSWNLDGNTIGATERKFGTLDNQDIPLVTNGTEYGRFTRDGHLLLGLNAPNVYVRNNLATLPDGGTASRLIVTSNTGEGDITMLTSGASVTPYFNIARSRGTVSSPQAVIANDDLGLINFFGYNGTGYTRTATISGKAEGITSGVVRSSLLFNTVDGEAMRVLANRNVGVGIATPELKLDVLGTLGIRNGAAWDHLYMQHDGSTAIFRAGGAETGLALQVGASATGSYGDASQNYRDVMRLMPSGRVGIGTTSPQNLLDLGSSIGSSPSDVAAKKLSLYNDASGNDFYGFGISASQMHLYTNSTTGAAPKMTFNSNGNVGIGTTAPTALLDVNGSTRLRGLTGTGSRVVTTDANGNLSATQAFPDGTNFIQNQTAADQAASFRISGGGNIAGFLGIGTTPAATSAPLTIGSNLVGPSIQIQNTNTGSVGETRMVNDNSSSFFGIGINNTAHPSAANQAFIWQYANFAMRFGTNNTERLRITEAGNIGINTNAPSNTLDVNGTARVRSLTGMGTNIVTADANGVLGMSTGAALDATTASNGLTETSNDIRLGGALTQNTTIGLGANSLSFTSTSGTVGIGATSAARLHVRGTGNAWPATSGTTQSAGLISRLQTSDNAILDMGGNSSFGAWLQSTDISTLALNYPLVLNPNGGNVGVGTTAPQARLDVQGGAVINDATPTNSTQTQLRLSRPGASNESWGAYAEMALGRYAINTATDAQFTQLDFKLGRDSNILADQTVMTLRADQRVGINNTTPTNTLDINGTARVRSLTGTGTNIVTADANGVLGVSTAAALDATTASNGLTETGNNIQLGGTLTGNTTINQANFNFNLTGGNVGIGTTTPLSRLSITPTAVEPKITLWDGGSNTVHYGFGVSNLQLNYHVDAAAASHVFYQGGKNGDGTELMRISGNGRVGIGTTTPTQRLEVAGGSIKVSTAGQGIIFPDNTVQTTAATPGPTVAGFAGTIGALTAQNAYVFAGPTATITVTSTQKIVASASGAMGLASASTFNIQVGMCYQPIAGGTISNFVGVNYVQAPMSTERRIYSANATVTLPAGTYRVGMGVLNNSGVNLTNNDWVNGFVMVVN